MVYWIVDHLLFWKIYFWITFMTTKHNLLIIYVHYELSNSILQLKEYHCSSLPTKFKMEIQIKERQKQQIPQKQHLFKTSDTPYTCQCQGIPLPSQAVLVLWLSNKFDPNKIPLAKSPKKIFNLIFLSDLTLTLIVVNHKRPWYPIKLKIVCHSHLLL